MRAGHFKLQPTSYKIYAKESPNKRITFGVPNPTAVWWNRLGPQPPKIDPGRLGKPPLPALPKL